jgi:hypothetical protein
MNCNPFALLVLSTQKHNRRGFQAEGLIVNSRGLPPFTAPPDRATHIPHPEGVLVPLHCPVGVQYSRELQ